MLNNIKSHCEDSHVFDLGQQEGQSHIHRNGVNDLYFNPFNPKYLEWYSTMPWSGTNHSGL